MADEPKASNKPRVARRPAVAATELSSAHADDARHELLMRDRQGEQLELDVQPLGPSEDDVARLRDALLAYPIVGRTLEGAESRVLSFRVDDDGTVNW